MVINKNNTIFYRFRKKMTVSIWDVSVVCVKKFDYSKIPRKATAIGQIGLINKFFFLC